MLRQNTWILATVLCVLGCGTSAGGGASQDASTTDDGILNDAGKADADVAGSEIAGEDTLTDVAADVPTGSDAPDIDTPDIFVKDSEGTDVVLTDVAEDIAPADIQPIDVTFPPDTDGNPEMCSSGFPGSGYCTTADKVCWSPPCPKCGAKPMGWCVPAVSQPFCYDYTGCGSGVCHGAIGMQAQAGFCVEAIKKAGQCWPDASTLLPQCLSGSTCEGAFVCPPWAKCLKPSSPGNCVGDTAHQGKVYLWTRNGGLVGPGEVVTVTWVNLTDKPVFLPGCTTYNVHQGDGNGGWKDLGPPAACAWEGTAVEVPPGGYVDTMPWTAPNNMPSGNLPTYRLEGTYSVGCTPGQPISQGKCTGSTTVDSDTMTVGMAQ